MSKSVKLKVPFAFDDEKRLYDPHIAEKGKHYFCLACKDTVILRKGEIKTPHFAHKASEICNQETIIHRIAKQLFFLRLTLMVEFPNRTEFYTETLKFASLRS
ncbi:hypothetical protein J5I95_11845 [Candidatus Poribacteria bacterium]|nr:hypothetical protein [Candidatus Poribacteria bacterium]